jgi:hypothetical protein
MLVTCACIAAAGCGGQHTAAPPKPVTSTAPIPGNPGVPRWLRIEIWRILSDSDDRHPKIVVTLNRHEHGRVVDRVWMRGLFLPGCTRPQMSGYTFDVRTRLSISSSWSAHCGK